MNGQERRGFLKAAGKAGTAIALASLPLANSCKGGDPSGPEPLDPIPVNLEFKVYNHTQGLKASFTKDQIMSGTKLALNIADRGYVLETGTVVLEGTAAELAQNENVKRAYLGG